MKLNYLITLLVTSFVYVGIVEADLLQRVKASLFISHKKVYGANEQKVETDEMQTLLSHPKSAGETKNYRFLSNANYRITNEGGIFNLKRGDELVLIEQLPADPGHWKNTLEQYTALIAPVADCKELIEKNEVSDRCKAHALKVRFNDLQTSGLNRLPWEQTGFTIDLIQDKKETVAELGRHPVYYRPIAELLSKEADGNPADMTYDGDLQMMASKTSHFYVDRDKMVSCLGEYTGGRIQMGSSISAGFCLRTVNFKVIKK